MTADGAEVSAVLIQRVSAWLEQSALLGMSLEEVVTGTCERLTAAGLPLARVHLSFSMLHPLYDALGFTWKRGEPLTVEGFQARRDDARPERFLKSPYFHLLKHKLDHLRRRIDPSVRAEFPIFDDLKAAGITDYLAFVQSFDDTAGQGMLGSWATDAASGFTDSGIEALLRIQAKLAISAKMAVLNQLADNMMSTYLGDSAGKRVLSGKTRRGDAEVIRAALVMVDMRESTMLAEQTGREVYVETLNQFFEAIATPFHRNGGEILSFVGDGFLAVYPCERHQAPAELASRAALAASYQAISRMADLNRERKEAGRPRIGFGIGLHVGNVMFGNVGLKHRLTFSAFGSAVNEAQRLENLTKKFGVPVVASQEFRDYAGGDWQLIGKEKLRGIDRKVSVFIPGERDTALDEAILPERESLDTRSDAEQVMLLYRNAATQPPEKATDRIN